MDNRCTGLTARRLQFGLITFVVAVIVGGRILHLNLVPFSAGEQVFPDVNKGPFVDMAGRHTMESIGWPCVIYSRPKGWHGPYKELGSTGLMAIPINLGFGVICVLLVGLAVELLLYRRYVAIRMTRRLIEFLRHTDAECCEDSGEYSPPTRHDGPKE